MGKVFDLSGREIPVAARHRLAAGKVAGVIGGTAIVCSFWYGVLMMLGTPAGWAIVAIVPIGALASAGLAVMVSGVR